MRKLEALKVGGSKEKEKKTHSMTLKGYFSSY